MKVKKKNQTDATLRNVRAAKKNIAQLWERQIHFEDLLMKYINDHELLVKILKGKRLLTPAQVKMLEDALR